MTESEKTLLKSTIDGLVEHEREVLSEMHTGRKIDGWSLNEQEAYIRGIENARAMMLATISLKK